MTCGRDGFGTLVENSALLSSQCICEDLYVSGVALR